MTHPRAEELVPIKHLKLPMPTDMHTLRILKANFATIHANYKVKKKSYLPWTLISEMA